MSLSNWNDKKNGAQMYLQDVYKEEGAKSLLIDRLLGDYGVKILTQTETDLPTVVTVVFWGWWNYSTINDNSYITHFFRYQDLDNYFSVTLCNNGTTSVTTRFEERVSGVLSLLDSNATPVSPTETWRRFKIEFYEDASNILVDIYKEVASAWVLQHQLSSSTKRWASGGAYGVGFEERGHNPDFACIDTTLVYYGFIGAGGSALPIFAKMLGV